MTDYAIRISPGSSWEQIREQLIAEWSVEFLATENFKIILHHNSSHIQLIEDSNTPECDITAIGNLSLGIGMFDYKGRTAVVRIKSNDLTAEQNEEINSAISEYLRPLWNEAREVGHTREKALQAAIKLQEHLQ